MKVIFRSNNNFAKRSLRNNAEVWVESLRKYLSEDAILNLSLFVNEENVAKATLNIVDKDNHIYATHEDVSFSVALDSVVDKCAKQIIKKQSKDKSYRETIRDVDQINYSYESELNSKTADAFSFVEIEQQLNNMKQTSRYNKTMSRYISYLYRNNEIEENRERLKTLYSILESMDDEEMTVADYKRLCLSIMGLEKEIYSLTKKQTNFENCKRDQEYINDVYEKEAILAKLKR